VNKAVVLRAVANSLDGGRTTAADAPPTVGAEAKDSELPALGGITVRLSKLTADGPVGLVVLRGYPGQGGGSRGPASAGRCPAPA
jgi:hypothetical protein